MKTWILSLWAFGLVCLAGTAKGEAAPLPRLTIPLWGRFEASLTNSHFYKNPFTDVSLRTRFTRPDKSEVNFWGFHDGDGHGGQTGEIWKLRFMPDQLGRWSYEASFSDGAAVTAGQFECVAKAAKPGPLRTDSGNPHCWKFADGTRFFLRPYTAPKLFVTGNELYWKSWVNYFFGGRYPFNFCNANLFLLLSREVWKLG